MMRITDILYTIPDILLIILLAMAIKEPLENLATQPGFGWMQKLGPNMVSIFIIFALLYWVGMARIVRSQVLTLKESEYVTAARALGASGGRIIKKHLLTNCIGKMCIRDSPSGACNRTSGASSAGWRPLFWPPSGRSVAQPQATNPFFERVSAKVSPKW